jgi:hypothetical protein
MFFNASFEFTMDVIGRNLYIPANYRIIKLSKHRPKDSKLIQRGFESIKESIPASLSPTD